MSFQYQEFISKLQHLNQSDANGMVGVDCCTKRDHDEGGIASDPELTRPLFADRDRESESDNALDNDFDDFSSYASSFSCEEDCDGALLVEEILTHELEEREMEIGDSKEAIFSEREDDQDSEPGFKVDGNLENAYKECEEIVIVEQVQSKIIVFSSFHILNSIYAYWS